MFPSNPNPAADNMNYTAVVSGGWIGLCLVYYYFPRYGGIHWFSVPTANNERIGSVEVMDETTTKNKEDRYPQD